MIYNPEKLTIIDGFDITPERHQELMQRYIHGSRGDILARICNAPDSDLPPNERYSLLVAVGSMLVASTIEEIQDAMHVGKI